ncbi:MAG: VWA domain-containing protein [Ectothiorhodospiraceae bacterium]|nr:VWA domain-containing protein [Chromatiales bacterium]MCP5155732.1 VWA domain-containing protein [Ectothiorhodospiraceae bacterium]
MLELGQPWALAALALPLLVAWLVPPARGDAGPGLRVPFYATLDGAVGTTARARPRRLMVLTGLAWCLLVVAAARPQWLGDPLGIPVTGRDLVLAVDLSGSMRYRDMVLDGAPATRLAVVQRVAGEFIERRRGDRVGLVLFGDRAYLHVPLTFDRRAARTMLAESAIGLAGEKTAIGDALGIALKHLRDRPAENRVVVLLTDGANTAGAVAPVEAARLAASAGLRVYTIGVGAEEMLVRQMLGVRRVNPSAELDEETLRAIAETTGGRYFRARDTAGLASIYAELDAIEPAAPEDQRLRPVEELFHWPLGAALVLVVSLALGARARSIVRARATTRATPRELVTGDA